MPIGNTLHFIYAQWIDKSFRQNHFGDALVESFGELANKVDKILEKKLLGYRSRAELVAER